MVLIDVLKTEEQSGGTGIDSYRIPTTCKVGYGFLEKLDYSEGFIAE